MSSSPILPIEILENIVDLLSDDRVSLLRWALVSRNFTARSQKYLFHRVRLGFPGTSENHFMSARISRFVDSLTPRLVRYIKHLSIYNYIESSVPWLGHDRKLALLLPKIEKLESFTLSGPRDVAANKLSPNLLSVLITMLASAEVSEFNLFEIDSFPIAFLGRYCPCIRSITFSLHRTSTPDSGDNLSLPHLRVPTNAGFVERVVLCAASTCFIAALYEETKLPGTCLSFARVQEIEVGSCDDSTLELIKKLLGDSAATPSLKKLSCNFREVSDFSLSNFMQELHLIWLPCSLRKLQIEILHETGAHFLDWLSVALLNSAEVEGGSRRPLEELVLVIHNKRFPDATATLWEAMDAQCAALDRALSVPAYAVALRRVDIFVEVAREFFYTPYAKTQQNLMEDEVFVSYFSRSIDDLYARLPRLRARGIVSVKWRIRRRGNAA
ncbi:hypothetical protein H0H81_009788 [Sphagnurus paluster]|uniref:F-box domain-containing protein n=1 Tax=Sphagnurus paluster TaxID=117069 RepID=A0A9P7G0Y7_9AGAR|nr:hypothetical protein H0H81_009788 [Sphagnurus paluster]